MKNFYFKQVLILSNTQKSANQFKFEKKYNLVTANDNSVGKSTLVKLLLWGLGCDPVLDSTWKSLDCKVLIKFTIGGEDYSVMRDGDIVYWKAGDSNFKKYKGISGEYAKVFAKAVNFRVLLPNRSEDSKLVTPPPAYYFLPFYIDQKKSWSDVWDNFENLGQFSKWKEIVTKYHVGYLGAKYFEYEEEYIEEQLKMNAYSGEIEKIDYALEVVSNHVGNKGITLDRKIFESMTEEIEVELSSLSNLQEKLLNNLSNYISDKVYLEHQKIFAEKLMKELDKDYVFSVENVSGDELECPLCGVVHENTLVNRASILSDKEQAGKQLLTIDGKLNNIISKIIKIETEVTGVKSKIDQINSKYSIVEDSKEIKFNEVIETLAYQSINRNINETKKEKLAEIDDCKTNQKSIKKDQRGLLTKERKEEIDNSFVDLLKVYIKILDVEEINLSNSTFAHKF